MRNELSSPIHSPVRTILQSVSALRPRRILQLVPCCALLAGCSLKGMAVNTLANSLSEGGSSVYLADEDPILVEEALPFGLKLMETVLQRTPDHEGLLLASASGFTMYAHAFVLRKARILEATDPRGARAELSRAKALFLRGRAYAGRALEVRHPGILPALTAKPDSAALQLRKVDVPAMYWYAAAHGGAVSSDKGDVGLVADFPVVPALLARAEALDHGWSQGAIHELLIVVEASTGAGGFERAEYHFLKTRELNQGRSIAPLVSMAETVCVAQQDLPRFTLLLAQAKNFDLESAPELRLANTLAQESATRLLARIDELFLEVPGSWPGTRDPGGGDVTWPIRQ